MASLPTSELFPIMKSTRPSATNMNSRNQYPFPFFTGIIHCTKFSSGFEKFSLAPNASYLQSFSRSRSIFASSPKIPQVSICLFRTMKDNVSLLSKMIQVDSSELKWCLAHEDMLRGGCIRWLCYKDRRRITLNQEPEKSCIKNTDLHKVQSIKMTALNYALASHINTLYTLLAKLRLYFVLYSIVP